VDALVANAGRAVVGLRIVVDPNGAVIQAADSPVVADSAGPWHTAFRASAIDAVKRWRFHPAEFLRMSPGEDYDGDGKPDFDRVTVREPMTVYLDIRFEFSILDGEGVVTGGISPAPTP
jgi:hypothetical protein